MLEQAPLSMPPSPPKTRLLVTSPGGPRARELAESSAPGAPALAEEESGLRPAKTRSQRDADAHGVLLQLEGEAQALVRGLEAIRFALHPRTGPDARRLKGQAQGLAHVRDGLVQVLGAARGVPRLFREDTAFVEYLRGLAAWAHATREAIDDLARARETERGSRVRVELAKSLHFDELVGEVERELAEEGAYDPAVDPVREALRRLAFVASALERQL
ncbi:MAG TPA: hypothetical protein PLR99_11865 [Polyangiaceae bacterium]|nr:hypothetical protein [Polyangiaceae bacterium]